MAFEQNHKKLIIYIPALNEEEHIVQVISSLPQQIDGLDQIDVLVIDDGSTDQTAELARKTNAHVISHHRNLGLGKAFQSAKRYALEHNAAILVGIDADGQFDPADIPGMIAPILNSKGQMVTGNRFVNGKPDNMPAIKYWGNNQVSRILSFLTKDNFQDVSCGFRAYSREALLQMNLFGTYSYTHETIMNMAFKGFKVYEHPISVKYFSDRKSRIAGSISKYAYNTGKIIFRTMLDYKPLLLFGNLGIVNMLIASFFIGFMLIHYMLTGEFTPYKSFGFIGLGFAIFGLIILFIGLVADMLNRIRVNQDKILYETRKSRLSQNPAKDQD